MKVMKYGRGPERKGENLAEAASIFCKILLLYLRIDAWMYRASLKDMYFFKFGGIVRPVV